MPIAEADWAALGRDGHLKTKKQASAPARNHLGLFYDVISLQIRNGDAATARRLIWRAAFSPTATLNWLARLNDLCRQANVAAIPFDVARKPGRSFLNRSLQQRERISLLAGHYDSVAQSFGLSVVGALLRGDCLLLPPIVGRSGAIYRLQLSRSQQNRQEGEMNLRLVREEVDQCIASLPFVVGPLEPGAPSDFWIGGLQGCAGPDSKGLTVAATKDLWGLRPKDLLLHMAYALAVVLGAQSLKAISNAHHVHCRSNGRRSWSADYDAFWRELGGQSIAGGYFRLPPVRTRRPLDDVPSAKRKAWRTRYALVDALAEDIRRLGVEPKRAVTPMDRDRRAA